MTRFTTVPPGRTWVRARDRMFLMPQKRAIKPDAPFNVERSND